MTYRDCVENCSPACADYATCDQVQAAAKTVDAPPTCPAHAALVARIERLERTIARIRRVLEGGDDG